MTSRILPFEMKNIPFILDVVVPMWSPPLEDEGFRRFYVENILRNNFFENTLHYELVEHNTETGLDEFCAAAFFARKGDVCRAEDWFAVESKKYPEELKSSCNMSREYIEEMDRKTFGMMDEDDIKLTLYVSRKRGCGSKLLNQLCEDFKAKGYKKLYLWTDCECTWDWYTEHGYELVEQGVYKPFSSEKEDYKMFVFRKEL